MTKAKKKSALEALNFIIGELLIPQDAEEATLINAKIQTILSALQPPAKVDLSAIQLAAQKAYLDSDKWMQPLDALYFGINFCFARGYLQAAGLGD